MKDCVDSQYDPRHCTRIDPKQGYALSPALASTPDLFVATECISGIECEILVKRDTPNYWNLAWTKFASSLGPHAAMAINAKHTKSGTRTRTHDQLHIHLSCIDLKLTQALDADTNIKKVPSWIIQTIPSSIGAYKYWVAFLEHEGDLASYNLFKIVYDLHNSQPDLMQYQTLIVARRSKGGLYILNSDTATPELNPGISNGERLLKGC
ncbi:MAG: CDP-diacylglycerol diphosphatase [Ktedonobacteraceae bacterium]|nr:CDP-diacylglycerol diphosphatase [Ktedonobacteraceae bacterium]